MEHHQRDTWGAMEHHRRDTWGTMEHHRRDTYTWGAMEHHRRNTERCALHWLYQVPLGSHKVPCHASCELAVPGPTRHPQSC